jgi:hypothetical protein
VVLLKHAEIVLGGRRRRQLKTELKGQGAGDYQARIEERMSTRGIPSVGRGGKVDNRWIVDLCQCFPVAQNAVRHRIGGVHVGEVVACGD